MAAVRQARDLLQVVRRHWRHLAPSARFRALDDNAKSAYLSLDPEHSTYAWPCPGQVLTKPTSLVCRPPSKPCNMLTPSGSRSGLDQTHELGVQATEQAVEHAEAERQRSPSRQTRQGWHLIQMHCSAQLQTGRQLILKYTWAAWQLGSDTERCML